MREVFRRHFDSAELRRIDHLLKKFEVLLARRLTARKLEKWTAVVHLRMTQLATTPSFSLSPSEVAQIKRAYFHAHGKAEREADKILAQHRIVVTAEDTGTETLLETNRLTAQIHLQLAEMAANAPAGQVMVFDQQATWRFIATQVILTAELDDQPYLEAATALAELELRFIESAKHEQTSLAGRLELAEARVDLELARLLKEHDLDQTVQEIQAAITTADFAEAAR